MSNHDGYTQTISTAEFDETPTLSLEQPTSDIRVEGWDKQEISVSVDSADSTFEIDQNGSEVTIRNRPGSSRLVQFVGPAAEELRGFGLDVERTAHRVEREVERAAARVERGMKRLGKGFKIEIDPMRWAGGRDYDIKVPYNCNLLLRTSSGDLRVSGVNGTIYLHSTSGEIKLKRASGTAVLQSASGDLQVDGIEGKLGVRTASGDVNVEEAKLDELTANSASGDLNFELLRIPSSAWEIQSVSGDINLTMPTDARLTAQLHTVSGSIKCGYPRDQVSYNSSSRRNTNLQINGGGSALDVQTVSGDVSFLPVRSTSLSINVGGNKDKSTGATAGATVWTEAQAEHDLAPTVDLSRSAEQSSEAARVAAPGKSDAERAESLATRRQAEMDILQAVARGEMSAEDAQRQLSALDG